jgi:hypothetical protein
MHGVAVAIPEGLGFNAKGNSDPGVRRMTRLFYDLEFQMQQILEFPKRFSEKEAAAYLSVSLSTIRRWRRRHTGPDV